LQAGVAQTLEEVEASTKWNPIQVLEVPKDKETLLQSTLLSIDVLENYK